MPSLQPPLPPPPPESSQSPSFILPPHLGIRRKPKPGRTEKQKVLLQACISRNPAPKVRPAVWAGTGEGESKSMHPHLGDGKWGGGEWGGESRGRVGPDVLGAFPHVLSPLPQLPCSPTCVGEQGKGKKEQRRHLTETGADSDVGEKGRMPERK